MKQSFFFIAVFVILLNAAQFSAATHINDYSATYTLVDDKAIVELSLNATNTTLDWQIPLDATAVEVNQDYTLKKYSSYQKLAINVSTKPVKIKYLTATVVEVGPDYFFILELSQIDSLKQKITLNLPEGASLKYPINSEKNAIMPTPESVTTDGTKIIITWTEKSFVAGHAIFVIYDEPNEDSLLWIGLISGIILVILVGVLFLIIRKRTKKSTKNKDLKHKKTTDNEKNGDAAEGEKLPINQADIHAKEFTRNLFEDEKKIVEILLKEGELWQKQLELKSGLNKVRLSRKLRSLEAKGVIEKISYGNTNKIRIKEKNKENND